MLHSEFSLTSVRDFLRKIKANYVFASILDVIDLEFGFSRVDFPPKGSKSKQIVVIYAKTLVLEVLRVAQKMPSECVFWV